MSEESLFQREAFQSNALLEDTYESIGLSGQMFPLVSLFPEKGILPYLWGISEKTSYNLQIPPLESLCSGVPPIELAKRPA